MPENLNNRSGISEFAEFVRWHYDDVLNQYLEFGRSTLAVLGFNAVVLTLGASHLSRVEKWSAGLTAVGTGSLILSLIFGLEAMRPRRIQSVDAEVLRAEFDLLNSGGAKFRYPDQILEHLLHSHHESLNGSPLIKLRGSVKRRGRCLLAMMYLSATGAIAYGVSLLIEMRM